MHEEAREVLPRVLDAIGFRRGLLVGHSDGASIATIYVGTIQDHRIRGLALMAPHFFTEDMGIEEIARAYDGRVRVAKLDTDEAPATAQRFGLDDRHCFDPARNLDAGARYLRWLLDRFDGRLAHALAGYNAGEGTVDRYGGVPPYRETQGYIRRIFKVLGVEEGAVGEAVVAAR